MNRRTNRARNLRLDGEKGQILALVIVFMLLTFTLITTLAVFTMNAVKLQGIHKESGDELYAADAGLREAIWQIRYDQLETYTSYDLSICDNYNYHGFNSTVMNPGIWDYTLAQAVNNLQVSTTVNNVWVPGSALDITGYTPQQLSSIIQNGKLDNTITSGSIIIKGVVTNPIGIAPPAAGDYNYQIKILYTPKPADVSLDITSVGIWIPNGFTYVSGGSNLEDSTSISKDYHISPVTPQNSAGGTIAVLNLPNPIPTPGYPASGISPNIDPLPSFSTGTPYVYTIDLQITRNASTPASTQLTAVSWVTSATTNLPFAWDDDIRYYKINSTAGDANVESYTTKISMRQLGSSISGDYFVVGNTLMEPSPPPSNQHYRDRLYENSSGTLSTSADPAQGIPDDATIRAAYLYWSGWQESGNNTSQTRVPTGDGDIGGDWTSTSGSATTVTKDPSTNSGSAWTNPSGAYSDGGNIASTTSGSGSNTWGDYGFQVHGYTVTGVRIGFDAWADASGGGSSPTYVGAGNVDDGTWITPGLPYGWAEDDIFLLFIETANETVNAPDGWSEVSSSPQGTSSGWGNPTRLTVFWKRAGSFENAPTISLWGGDHIIGQILAFRGCISSGEPWDITVGDTSSSSSSVNIPGATTSVNNCLIVAAVANGTDRRNSQTSSWSNSYLTNLMERVDNNTRSGNGGGFGVATGIKVTAGYYGDTSATLASSSMQGRISIALKPKSSVDEQIKIEVSGDGGTNWYTVATETLSATETWYGWYDVYNDVSIPITWDSDTLDDGYFLVRASALTVGSPSTVFLDYLPVEVTYTTTELYSAVDENDGSIPRDDSDYITGSTDSGGYTLFTYPSFNIPTNATITDLTIHVRATDGTSSYFNRGNINARIKIGSMYYDGSGDSTSYGSEYETFTYTWNRNPSTNIAWTVEDINNTGGIHSLLQFGVYSNDLNPDVMVSMVYAEVNYTEEAVSATKVNQVMLTITDNTTATSYQYPISTSEYQTKSNPDADPDAWSYSCFEDITPYVQGLIDNGDLPLNGAADYTIGHAHVNGTGTCDLYDINGGSGSHTDYPLSIPAANTSDGKYQYTYAGWAIIFIYDSPDATVQRQLYLFDEFRYVGLDTDELPFTISGFLAPPDTTGSHLTYFIGEGDDHYVSEFIEINGYTLPLSGDTYEAQAGYLNPQNNPFNSKSNSLTDVSRSGVDIDTFDVSGCIAPADSSATVILNNGETNYFSGTSEEIYNLVFIILAFRSDIVSGDTISYLVH